MFCVLKVSVILCLMMMSTESAISSSSHSVNYNKRPKYAFDYTVSHPLTGDIKSQWETRDGDLVRGEYSVLDPDGIMRTVSYTADRHTGFQAVVKRTKLRQIPSFVRHNLV